jgi:peptidoglycan/xylan/chitin deacetylase (PgdA/CDA1 family)
LTLHRVVDKPERDHDLQWSSFTALLDAIAANRLGVSAELGWPRSRSVLLTFDDGTSDHRRAAEELASRGLSAIFFVPVGVIDEPSKLDSSDVRRLVELGQVIGSHTIDHVRLDELDAPRLRRQVFESKERLEALIEGEVEFFAAPGGSHHPILVNVLEEAGYIAARSMRWGFYESPTQRWDVPCMPVTRFTWRSGWVERALARWELPRTMSMAWRIKRRLPQNAAMGIRRLISR